MSNDEIRKLILAELHRIAPEVELGQIDPASELREQVDLDSMDVLNWMIALHKKTGIEIPEADYKRMATIDECVAYLAERMK
ncbi:MAG TPA: acyl carrier protein [Candidatus Binataceae bacterium]|nr:acyl carrier protein [Candidatus Binataceae bacterium]